MSLLNSQFIYSNDVLGQTNHPILQFSDNLNSDKSLSDEQRQKLEAKIKEIELEKSKVINLKSQIDDQKKFLTNSSSDSNRLRAELDKSDSVTIPSDWDDLDRAGIEQELFKQEALTLTSQKSLQEIQQEIKKITTERLELPQRIAKLKDELEKFKDNNGTLRAEDSEKKILADYTAVHQERLQLEIDLAEKQLLGYEKRQELLKLREQKSQRKLTRDNDLVQKIKELLHSRREQEAKLAIEQAKVASEQAAKSIPQIRDLAEELTSLAKRRTGQDGLTIKIRQAEEELQKLTEKNDQLERDQQKLVEKVNVVGMTDVIGILFRNVRSELPNLRQYHVENKRRRSQISAIQLEILETEE